MTATTPVDPETVLASKRKARDAAIDKLMEEAQSRGSSADRAFWAMVYDFDQAPTTTNRKQLAEIGVDVPEPGAVASLPDDVVPARLKAIVEGLAALRIYLLHTNHLTDRQLLACLVDDVLGEEVRDTGGALCIQEGVDVADMDDAVTYARWYDEDGNPRVFADFPSNRDDSLPRPDDKPPHHQP